MTIKKVAERQRMNPDTGEWEYMGVDEEGNTIAKDDLSARKVAQEFLKEYGAELKRQGLLGPETLTYLQERMDVLYPEGYTKVELAEVAKRGIAIGDITKPEPVHEGPSADEQRIAEYESFSKAASQQQRQSRRDSDVGFREWYQREFLIQRQGSDVTAADLPAIIEPNLVAFVEMWNRTPAELLRRPRNGYVSTPGFLSGRLTVDELDQWHATAKKARLLR